MNEEASVIYSVIYYLHRKVLDIPPGTGATNRSLLVDNTVIIIIVMAMFGDGLGNV